jgi:hypothetical protein
VRRLSNPFRRKNFETKRRWNAAGMIREIGGKYPGCKRNGAGNTRKISGTEGGKFSALPVKIQHLCRVFSAFFAFSGNFRFFLCGAGDSARRGKDTNDSGTSLQKTQAVPCSRTKIELRSLSVTLWLGFAHDPFWNLQRDF